MKVERREVALAERTETIRQLLHSDSNRLGLISSINGNQLISLVLNPNEGAAVCWESPLQTKQYHSLVPVISEAHWFERTMWDMFGLEPENHPRLKHNLLHEAYSSSLLPLNLDFDSSLNGKSQSTGDDTGNGAGNDNGEDIGNVGGRDYKPMAVKGDGIYEIPVGPIHAGIIEPGHFRFSCLGEVIFNLEIRLGYVHRGVEKRLCEVPWRKQRFLVEAAASDSAAAYALAHSIAIESLFDQSVPAKAEFLRTISLEIERAAMHINDLGGLAGDIGYLAISSTMGRLRGVALSMAEQLTGSRLQRNFICPGGVVFDPSLKLRDIKNSAHQLRISLQPVMTFFMSNEVARDRMENIGKISARLAADFGLVGPAGRASDQRYDARQHFKHGVYPKIRVPVAVETDGDVLSRAKVRIAELDTSLFLIEQLIDGLPEGDAFVKLPDNLPKNAAGLGIVEAHRGELIHLVFTDEDGKCSRYAIKDPSVNNWTGLAIAVRNNLVSDFPLCNKSFGLSYSGHDL